MILLEYPKCGTCRKAKKWLEDNSVSFEDRHIIEDRPTYDELNKWYQMSGLPLKKFFNTSGMKYREMGLKDRISEMTDEEMLEILSGDGMIVKRPLVIGDDFVLVGFKESEWERLK